MIIHTASYLTIGGDAPGRIAISRAVPRGTPRGYKVARELAPPGPLLRAYKGGELTGLEFADLYRRETLGRLDPRATLRRLQRLAREAQPSGPPLLLCWEIDEPCHRHLVAEWLEGLPGVDVTEVEDPRLA